MFENKLADISLFLNAVGNAFVANSSPVWNDTMGLTHQMKLGDMRLPLIDTYTLTIEDDTVPGITKLESDPNSGGKDAAALAAARHFLSDLSLGTTYAPSKESGQDVLMRAMTSEDNNIGNLYLTKGQQILQTARSYADAVQASNMKQADYQLGMIDVYLKDVPRLDGAVSDLLADIRDNGDQLNASIEKEFERRIKQESSHAAVKDAPAAVASDIRFEANQPTLTLKRTSAETAAGKRTMGSIPTKRKLGVTEHKEVSASEMYGTQTEGNIPVTVVKILPTPDNKKRYGALFGDDKNAIGSNDIVEIWTDTTNRKFTIFRGEGASRERIGGIYDVDTTSTQPYKWTGKGDARKELNGMLDKVTKKGVETYRDTSYNTEYSGFKFIKIVDNDVVNVAESDIGQEEDQIAVYAGDGLPFMRSKYINGRIVWVSTREGNDDKIINVTGIQKRTESEGIESNDAFYKGITPEMTRRYETDTRAIEAYNKRNIVILDLLASNNSKTRTVAENTRDFRENWDAALKMLGFDPSLVGGLTRRDKNGIKWGIMRGYDRSNDKSYEGLDFYVDSHRALGERDIPYSDKIAPEDLGARTGFGIVDNSNDVDRFIPTVRMMANRILHIHGLANRWGSGKQNLQATDVDTIMGILGVDEKGYEDLLAKSKETNRNLVGEQVSYWLNTETEKLLDVVRSHYQRKQEWLQQKINSGSISAEDVRALAEGKVLRDNGEPINEKKIDFDGSYDGSFDAAFLSAAHSQLSIETNLTKEEREALAQNSLQDFKNLILLDGASKEKFSDTFKNEFVSKYIEDYQQYKKKLEMDNVGLPPDQQLSQDAIVEKATEYARKGLPSSIEDSVEFAIDVTDDTKLGLECGLTSNMLEKLQNGEKLQPWDIQMYDQLIDFINKEYQGNGITETSMTRDTAIEALKGLRNGAKTKLRPDEQIAIQKVVSQKAIPEVTDTLRDLTNLGVLKTTVFKNAFNGKDGKEVASDFTASSDVVRVLFEQKAIIPIMTKGELDALWEDWYAKYKPEFYRKAEQLASELHSDMRGKTVDLSEHPEYKALAAMTLDGNSTRAWRTVTRFMNEAFPEWIVREKRFKFTRPDESLNLMADVITAMRNKVDLDLPKNVFLTDEEREEQDDRKRDIIRQDILANKFDHITDDVFLAATGNTAPIKRRELNTSTIDVDTIQDDEWIADVVGDLIERASGDRFSTVNKWINSECTDIMGTAQNDEKVVGSVVKTGTINNIVDAVTRVIPKVIKGDDAKTLAESLYNDVNLRLAIGKKLSKWCKGTTDMYMAGNRFGDIDSESKQRLSNDLSSAVRARALQSLYDMYRDRYNTEDIIKMADELKTAWETTGAAEITIPGRKQINTNLADRRILAQAGGELAANNILNKIMPLIYDQELDVPIRDAENHYVTDADGKIQYEKQRVSDSPYLRGKLLGHIRKFQKNLATICRMTCESKLVKKDDRREQAVNSLG